MAETLVLPLATPITAHGESVTQLSLRTPRVGELRECGAPYRVDRKGGIVIDYEACAQLLSAICAIPLSSVNQMDAGDFDDASWRLVGFMKHSSADPMSAGSAPPTASSGS